MSEFEIVYL